MATGTRSLYCVIRTLRVLILVNNQLDAQLFFLICLFQSSTCFEQPRAHHQENQLYQYNVWYMSLCVGGRLVCRSGRNSSSFPICIPDDHVCSSQCSRFAWRYRGKLGNNPGTKFEIPTGFEPSTCHVGHHSISLFSEVESLGVCGNPDIEWSICFTV
jgi:hypothetical protein